MTSLDQLLYWAECWAGPADGELVPVNTEEPMADFPYLQTDGAVAWYTLYRTPGDTYRFVLVGAAVPTAWTPLL